MDSKLPVFGVRAGQQGEKETLRVREPDISSHIVCDRISDFLWLDLEDYWASSSPSK